MALKNFLLSYCCTDALLCLQILPPPVKQDSTAQRFVDDGVWLHSTSCFDSHVISGKWYLKWGIIIFGEIFAVKCNFTFWYFINVYVWVVFKIVRNDNFCDEYNFWNIDLNIYISIIIRIVARFFSAYICI